MSIRPEASRITGAAAFAVLAALMLIAAAHPSAQGRDAAAAPGPAGPSGTHVRLQMTVDGMNGNNPTPILSFQLDASNSSSSDTGGGGGAGKASFSDLRVAKLLDNLSVPLLKAVATGEHIKDVKIDIFDFGAPAPFATYTFSEVLATADALGSTQNQVSENVSFNFAKIASTITLNGMTFTSCFDLKANASC